jgi:caa(3)-type oxidase subunit IV
MSDHAATAHAHPNYIKIWAILLVLLCISIAGPFLGIPVVTLITAFGIAIVKAYMVAKNFMHLDIERQYVVYLILTMLVFVLLFFAGTAPDVMKWDGDNWVKPKVEQATSHVTHHDSAPAHHTE